MVVEVRHPSSRFAALFGIDLRAVAACRVALAWLLLFDIVQWSFNATAFLTDDGVMTVVAARDLWNSPGKWSLHFVSGSLAWQATLLSIAAVAAGMLFVGWRTTLAAIVSWVLLVSRHNRTPLVTTGGDWLLRLVLMWMIFLPSGRRWSLDARRRASSNRDGAVVSVASVAVLSQVATVYFFSGLWKWNDVWLSGEALQRAVELQTWVRPVGTMLASYPEVLQWLAWGTLAVELIAPWLLFVPWKTSYFRAFALAALFGLHVGIELCLDVGMFSYAALAGCLLFVPAGVWDRLERCAESPICGRQILSPTCTGTSEVGERIRLPPGVLSKGRYVRRALQVAGAVVLAFVLYSNIVGLAKFDAHRARLMPAEAWDVAYALNLEQRWNMFDRPATQDGWYVARASLRDGRLVDLLRPDRPIDDRYPGDVAGPRENQRWQKLFNNLTLPVYEPYLLPVTEFFTRQWNERHDDAGQALVVEMYYYREDKRPEVGLTNVTSMAVARVAMGTPEETDEFAELLRSIQRDRKKSP